MQDDNAKTAPVSHEKTDAAVRPIFFVTIALAFAVGIVGVLVYGVFGYLASTRATEDRRAPLANVDPQIPPAPHIEDHPERELQTLRTQEDKTLTTYGWVNKETGVVRVPLDRAIELQLRRGFPVRKEAPQR